MHYITSPVITVDSQSDRQIIFILLKTWLRRLRVCSDQQMWHNFTEIVQTFLACKKKKRQNV